MAVSFRAARSTAPASNVAINTAGAIAPLLPALLVVPGTTETVIPDPGILANALTLQIPPFSPLEQREFTLLASGNLTTATSSTVTIKLYSGTSLTVASNTLLGSTGALTAFTGTTPWVAKASLIYDSTSGKLTGKVEFLVNNTIVAAVAISNVITGVSNASNPVASFVLSVTFGTANAGNEINVQEFCIPDYNL